MAEGFTDLAVRGQRAHDEAALSAALGQPELAREGYARAALLGERAASLLRPGPHRTGRLVEAAWLWMRAGRAGEVDRLSRELRGGDLPEGQRSRLREAVLRAHPRPRGPLH